MGNGVMPQSRKRTGAKLLQLGQRRGFATVVGNPLRGFPNDECGAPLAPKLTGAER
jgi:hypothetical protein